jgi:ABC-type transport system involved in multi-copper enzyme maturation permease subunit
VTRALKAELLKLRTTRTFFALVGSAAALSLLFTVLAASLIKHPTDQDVHDTFANTDATGLFILLLGVIGMAGEWRHRTIASTVLAVPQRLRLLAAKVLSYAIAGVVLSLVVNVLSMAIGALIFSGRGAPAIPFSDLLDILWRNLVIAAYFGGMGVCLGALIRNPPVAIVVVLIAGFVVDPTLQGLVFNVWKFWPFGGVAGAISQTQPDGSDKVLSTGVGLLLIAGWLSVFFSAAAATFTKRDLV